jgi:hypothetical protein
MIIHFITIDVVLRIGITQVVRTLRLNRLRQLMPYGIIL